MLGLGPAGRMVWLIYGLIPLLLIPTGRGVEAAAARRGVPAIGRAALNNTVLPVWMLTLGLALATLRE